FAALLHRYGYQRAHDAEGSDDHDEEEEKKHYITLEPNRLEYLMVHIDPSPRELGDFEELFDLRLHLIDIIRIFGFNRDSVKCVHIIKECLSDEKRHQQILRTVYIMTGLEDSGHCQILRKHDFAQFFDGPFLLIAFGALEFLNSVENLGKIARRIDCHLIANLHI